MLIKHCLSSEKKNENKMKCAQNHKTTIKKDKRFLAISKEIYIVNS